MSYIFSFLMDYQMKLLVVENGVHRLVEGYKKGSKCIRVVEIGAL